MATRSRPVASMTGFGRGCAETGSAAVEVELRTVNGRGLSMKWRTPTDRQEIEATLDTLVRRSLERGSLHGVVKIARTGHRPAVIDHKLLRRYLREWRATERELGLEREDPSLAELLKLPGAIEPASESASEARSLATALNRAAKAAIAALLAARHAEGERLSGELLNHASRIAKGQSAIERLLPAARRRAATALRKRVAELQAAAEVSGSLDLSRELVLQAERADVQEEMARLTIHLERLRALLGRGGPCGRELEFLIQEIHREINTLGAKSSDVNITKHVVAMKTATARLKEQAANVE